MPVYAGILKASAEAMEKRRIEEETRVKIREDEERKRLEEEERIRQEEEAKRVEEEERIKQQEAEEERKRQAAEEEEKKKQAKLQPQKAVPMGGTFQVNDPEKAAKLKKISNCTQGFEWKKESGGWRCGGGGHDISDAQFDSL